MFTFWDVKASCVVLWMPAACSPPGLVSHFSSVLLSCVPYKVIYYTNWRLQFLFLDGVCIFKMQCGVFTY